MKSKRSRIQTRIGSALFQIIRWPVARMSPIMAEKFGAALGRFCWHVPLFKKQRTRAISNLEIAFPEKTEAERLKIAKGVFAHFGRVATDFMRSDRRTKEEVFAGIEVEGMENARAAEAIGSGGLAITAHFGNWERFGHWGSLMGWKLLVVARQANDKELDDLATNLRRNTGVEVISRGDAVKPILKRLAEGGVVAMLPDQNSGECFVPFFGKPAGTVMGPAVLHQRAKAPVLPMYCVRIAPAKYKVIILPMIDTDFTMTPEEITAELNLALESVVRQYPDQYLWVHDRWKSARRKGLL